MRAAFDGVWLTLDKAMGRRPGIRVRPTEETEGQNSCGLPVNVSGSDDLTDCLRCPAGRFTLEDGMRLCDCITPWSCGDAKAFKRDAVFTKCFVNDPSSTCDPADEETYSTFVRETSRFHLCFDTNDMFERRASQDLFDVEDPLSCT